MARSTVLVVEDDEPTRARLAAVVEAHPRLTLRGTAASCAEARKLLARERPDLLLTDLGLPDASGVELIVALRERQPRALALVITVFGDEASVVASLEAGANGYLLKDGTEEEIGQAIDLLLDGGAPISPPIARYLLKRFHPAEPASDAREPSAAGASAQLSAREKDVLELITRGFTYAEIGRLLGISDHTVNTHVRHIYQKLAVRSRGEAVYEAVNLGLVKIER